MKKDYQKLAEEYLQIAEQITKELKVEKNMIGCALFGSVARREVHPKSDIDLLALIDGCGVYECDRKIIKNVVVNIDLRSKDVLERMIEEHIYTIFFLKESLILYDPWGILQSFRDKATITESVKEELTGYLLDEARSFLGRSERALDENDLESSLICLRQSLIKLAELIFYEETGRRINTMRFYQEINMLSLPKGFKELFIEIHGFKTIEKAHMAKMLQRLEAFFPKLCDK